MDDHLYADLFEVFHSGIIGVQRITPTDERCGFGVYRLQTQFYPYGFDAVQPLQQSELILFKTVGSCGNRQAGDLLTLYHRKNQPLKIRNALIGIGKRLKISDIAVSVKFSADGLFCRFDLFRYGK